MEGFCLGFVAAISLHIASQKRLIEGVWPDVCLPNGASNEQLMLVFKNYMSKHPEHLHYLGSDVVIFALRDAFPCAGNRDSLAPR